MNCEKCHIEMEERKVTLQNPYRYDLSGLSNVYLAGITVRTCSTCKAAVPVIPRIAELHKVIAHALARKPTLLRGEEIRFLRKHGGFPAQKFAALLGVSPEHFSRVENGHYPSLSKSADRLARAIATTASDGETARDILLRIANELERKGQVAEQLPLFSLEQNHWKAAA